MKTEQDLLAESVPGLLHALNTLMRMDVKGHELQDRLQFSDTGRAILEQCQNAINKAKGV